MQKTPINAADAPQPVSHYHQAMLVEGAARVLHISGQIPVAADGTVPDGFEAQARQVWRNIEAQLRAADMSFDNLVKVTFFLSSREHTLVNRRVREEVLGDRDIALTAIICDIFDEAWLLEIEAVAAA
ncbi:MAG: RidA family protein [Pseudomonadota bacterium]